MFKYNYDVLPIYPNHKIPGRIVEPYDAENLNMKACWLVQDCVSLSWKTYRQVRQIFKSFNLSNCKNLCQRFSIWFKSERFSMKSFDKLHSEIDNRNAFRQTQNREKVCARYLIMHLTSVIKYCLKFVFVT